MRARWRIGLAAALMIMIAVGIAWAVSRHHTTAPADGNAPAPPVPVVTAPVRKADMPVYLTGLGAVVPLNTVTIRTRVDGQLMTVHFREGQIVVSGDRLAEIDPRPFQAQLAQYEGQLARDQALLDNARVDLKRYEVLWAQNSIPKQQLDTQVSLVHQYEGAVKNDQGLIDSTKVQLAYCRITSPIGGRVGLRLVDPGNIVHATDTSGIVVVAQLQPITVVFTVPEDNIPPVLDRLRRGSGPTVEAYDRAGQKKLSTGSLLTIDNQIDTTTGTVKLKAVFPNADNALFPNQFVNARLLLDVEHGAAVVPAAAIQRSPQGPFVYVVKADQTAAVRRVTVGASDGGNIAVASGLTPGEQVVVDGADRLRDGAKVSVASGA